MSMPSGRTRVGNYEMGRTIGNGRYAKVKFARNMQTGESVAIKILDKEKVLQHKMIDQIKREISSMKSVKHPNIVLLHEVMASKTKVYLVLEFAAGGQLFDKLIDHGRLKEDEARRYFQQLINAVDYCHSRGVYHRNLKPENLLLDTYGNLKVSDFGLSALPQQVRKDGLLHTACGTPNYVAPEVINCKGYDGAPADLWSCGVILYVMLAGCLPFDESNIINLYRKINKAEFTSPSWLSSSAKELITRILDPNPKTRITIPEIIEDAWFKKDYEPSELQAEDGVIIDDVDAVFSDSQEHLVTDKKDSVPGLKNAFELITRLQGVNLGSLFEKQMDTKKQEKRFISKCPVKEIMSNIEDAAKPLGFDVQKQNYKLRLRNAKAGRKGHLSIAAEVFEVAPSFVMVDLCKDGGDTLEFHEPALCSCFCALHAGWPAYYMLAINCMKDTQLVWPVQFAHFFTTLCFNIFRAVSSRAPLRDISSTWRCCVFFCRILN